MFLPRHTVRHLLLLMVAAAALGSVAYYATSEQADWARAILAAFGYGALFFLIAAMVYALASLSAGATRPLAERFRAKHSPFAVASAGGAVEPVSKDAAQEAEVFNAVLVTEKPSQDTSPQGTEDRS